LFRRLIFFGLILGFAAAMVKPQSSVIAPASPHSIPADAVIALAEEGLLIRILSDGTVLVEGQTFDFDIGRIKMRIGREEVRNLIDGFERINFFSLRDGYRDKADGCWDGGRTHCVLIMRTITLTLNGRTKSVTRYPYECLEKDGSSRPHELVALEKQIEDAVDLKRWRRGF
jgi:hypothetical protein